MKKSLSFSGFLGNTYYINCRHYIYRIFLNDKVQEWMDACV